MAVIGLLYLSATFVHLTPPNRPLPADMPQWKWGPVTLAPPQPLSGDSPHYLAAVVSLVQDGDFDLSNNYDSALAGGWDLGALFRRRNIDRHVDVTRGGAQIGTHSPFFALLLAPFAYPVRGTQWMGPACIWATMGAGLLAVWLLLRRCAKFGSKEEAWRCAAWLALATPLWCYSHDLWTEPWVAAVWAAMLLVDNPWAKAGLGLIGALIKYPFAVVPLTLGLLAFRRRDAKSGWLLLGSGVVPLLLVVGVTQYLFRGADHFSLFHSGIHQGFGLPGAGLVGLLLHPSEGILWFFPFLAWGLPEFRKGGDLYLPAAAFFLVHAAYQDWSAGTGFTARYLVPMLPALIWAVKERRPRGRLFMAAVAYSFLWGALAGLLPALVYDRTPWAAAFGIWKKLGWLLG